jgi:hypothetical protein
MVSIRTISIAVCALLPTHAFALDYSDITGVWTHVEAPEGSAPPILSKQEIARQCDSVINVFDTTPSYQSMLRQYVDDEPMMAVDLLPESPCSYDNSTLKCSSVLSVYLMGELVQSSEIDITSKFTELNKQQIAISTTGTFPDGDELVENNILYRCPMNLEDVDGWIEERPVQVTDSGINLSGLGSEIGNLIEEENNKLTELADGGDSEAAYHRGLRFTLAYVFPAIGEANHNEGLRYLTMAADNGHVMARAALGHATFMGAVLARQPFTWEDVSRHHSAAADKGVGDSINTIAMLHFLGKMPTQPPMAEIINMFIDAAKKGSLSAHANIAAIWALIPEHVLRDNNIPLPDDYLRLALGYAQHAANSDLQLGQVVTGFLKNKYSNLSSQGPINLDSGEGYPIDPNVKLLFTFKVTPEQVLFNDADINILYDPQ